LLIVLTVLEELTVGYLHHRTFADSMAEIGGGTLHQAIATSIILLLILIPFLCLSLACRGCRRTRAVSSLLRTTPKA
jgi:hypothetical protein